MKLPFLIARLSRNDLALARFSAPEADLLHDLAGRSVSLVGNARSLGEKKLGALIDAADMVIRLNAAPGTPAASHGRRADWLAMSVPVAGERIAALSPVRLIWVSPRRKRLPYHVANSAGFSIYPKSRHAALMAAIGHRPSTGLMMIEMLSRSNAVAIRLYGFDFFASLSLSGSRDQTAVPHDFAAERQYVEALIGRDSRFSLLS